MAASISHGMLVAPRTSKPLLLLPTPCIWTRNSVLIRREDSASPSPRALQRESTSSTKIIVGILSRAILNMVFTRRSLSPCHLDTRLDDDTDMNVASASVATAVARYDFPVPGGPYNKIPPK